MLMLAHMQPLTCLSIYLAPEQVVTCYDLHIRPDELGRLVADVDVTKVVVHPNYVEPRCLKEMCAGVGCIGVAAAQLGLQCLACIDVNEAAIMTLKNNTAPNPLLGDLNQPLDRLRFHRTPRASRCTMAAGFPCQPLSRQGDGRGNLDSRSEAFYSSLKSFWEQQGEILLLECVPQAHDAQYVQQALQKLGASMNKNLVQGKLNLHRTWPCRRSRWWCMVIPMNYNIASLPDLPEDPGLQRVDQLITEWPAWTQNEETQLKVTEEELRIFLDPTFGHDQRLLCTSLPCPCLLHSYGSVLSDCPCGCRRAFHPDRLRHGGVRGFYAASSQVDGFRYLHPKEAAILCSIPPSMILPQELKLGLCQIGQCAAPLQAVWVLSHLGFPSAPDHQQTPEFTLLHFKACLLRDMHGCWPSLQEEGMKFFDTQIDGMREVSFTPGQSLQDLLQAEHRLARDMEIRQIQDAWGPLPAHSRLRGQPIVGTYVMLTKKKKSAQDNMISYPVKVANQGVTMGECIMPAGSFLFEVFRAFGVNGFVQGILDHRGDHWRMDDSINNALYIVDFQLYGAGLTASLGTSDISLDIFAKTLLQQQGTFMGSRWLPVAHAMQIFSKPMSTVEAACFLGTLHGEVFTCWLLEGHWMLVHARVCKQMLMVTIWDGLCPVLWSSAAQAVERWANMLGLAKWSVNVRMLFQQQHAHSCGAVAMQHLGMLLGLWNCLDAPKEEELHRLLRHLSAEDHRLFGCGKQLTEEEKDVVRQLREVLEQHGVPPTHTEERALYGLQKIGIERLGEALRAKNQWGALKTLASQPRINMMWVKPMELEAQIKRRAQSKFKLHPAAKKKGRSSESSTLNIDPAHLELMPDSFVKEDGTSVLQIPMEQIGSNRAGLAFGRVTDVLPFLKEGKSLTMDGLAVLTTTPIPAELQGLLPVSDIRFPAIFVPTKEPLLVDGSLAQLGDELISRAKDDHIVEVMNVETITIRVTLFRDEWTGNWGDLIAAPVKLIASTYPPFVLCRGFKCGGQCAKFHPPVDSDLDAVVLDVWSRSWMTLRGQRADPREAEMFAVLMRVPKENYKNIQNLSGQNGLYIEPRQSDGRGPLDSTTVLWLPDQTLQEVTHKLKMTERAMAVARVGNKYGLRVPATEAAKIHQDLLPEQPFHHFHVQRIYEVRPLAHGTQRTSVVSMLKSWSWQAKPLQASRSDAQGMGWLIGSASEPPAMLFQTKNGDVTVTLQKEVVPKKQPPGILVSRRTQKHLQKDKTHIFEEKVMAPPAQSSSSSAAADPWAHYDPWMQNRSPLKNITNQDVDMAPSSKKQEIQEQLREELRVEFQQDLQNKMLHSIQAETDSRFAKLETNVTELKVQGKKFESWFAEAATANSQMQAQVVDIQNELAGQKAQTQDLTMEIRSGFSSIKNMFDNIIQPMDSESAKRQRDC